MTPDDRFTPHGYLDNPYHTRNLNPSGVIRSGPGLGFGWHYPALGGGYGYREIYRAALNLAVSALGVTQTEPGAAEGLYADRHTKNLVRLRWRCGPLALRASFHRVGEHALCCRLELGAEGAAAAEGVEARLAALCPYTRHLGAAGVWGESGLVGRFERGAVVVQGFEDGAAFALLADRPADAWGFAPAASRAFLAAPGGAERAGLVTGRRGESVTLVGAAAFDLVVTSGEEVALTLVLGRGLRRDLAVDAARAALAGADEALAALHAEDRAFWRLAPRLEADWPDSWRRGLVYDLETLRMMVRPPIGIYRHVWDAMQIQAPRVVLAEAAIDAWLLAYADVDLAKRMLLGTFLDAPAANVPCSREDGSYNMVGANGSECGTAPEWGYPVEVAARLHALDPDPAWLAAIYPRLAAFLEWWLEHRCDEGGFLVYDNSWESGQDLSERFGPQKEGGGSTIRAVRPVDLQAAAARAFARLAEFAATLGRGAEAERWAGLERDFRGRVESLWHDGAYRDADARVGWSDVGDVMQLAPVALGLAPEERVEALRPAIARLAEERYLWPMFVWTATGAALAAAEPEVAAAIAADTLTRAYDYWDDPVHRPGRPLPGVASEFWGLDGRCGAEGYGWGAFGVELLLGVIAGFAPAGEHLVLRPNLPPALLVPGRRYRVRNLCWRGVPLTLDYRIGAGASAQTAIDVTVIAPPDVALAAAGARANPLLLRVTNGERVELEVSRAEAEG